MRARGANSASKVSMFALEPFPIVREGDDLAREIVGAARTCNVRFESTDIVVVAQKVVSRVEGRVQPLADVRVSDRARRLASKSGKDPRIAALIVEEAVEVVRAVPGVVVVESRLGHIMANAGIDRSNVGPDGVRDDAVLLLPEDPDRSAAEIRRGIGEHAGARPGVIVSDSFGRPWRLGTTVVAIGTAGPPMVADRRGRPDLFGRTLEVSEIGFADSVAAAAGLVMGEGDEGRPVVVVRGLQWEECGQRSRDGLRARAQDLFR